MTEFVSVSETDLKERRKQLRRLRQMKILQSTWRTIAIAGIAGGLLWFSVQPMWVLVAPKQIEIDGNKLFPDEAIRSQLALSHPKSIWRIQPALIEKSLLEQPLIAKVVVNRRLFPPRLVVQVQERQPVAVVLVENEASSESDIYEAKTKKQNSSVALLDADGVLIPLDKYTSLNPKTNLPKLRVKGYSDKLRSQWVEIYQVLKQSSLRVTQINFQNPNNLILQTELGTVHFGIPSSLFSMQVETLLQMQQLREKLDFQDINYIDIKNPEQPSVQINDKKTKRKK